MLDALKTKKAKAKAVADEATKEAATKEAATKEQTMSAEDAAPAKAEAAVQIWHGFSSVLVTVTHIPAGLYFDGSSRTPGTPEASCDTASLLRALRSPETEVPTGFPDVLCIQVKKYASNFRTLALIGVAAAFCAVVKNDGCASPTSTKALTSAYGSACPPQWLPVLLTFNSCHDGSPLPPRSTRSRRGSATRRTAQCRRTA